MELRQLPCHRHPAVGAAGIGQVRPACGPVGGEPRRARSSVARPPPRSGARHRPDPLRGRNPSKTQRPAGSPLPTTAVTAAEGPGTTSTAYPASRAARTSALPGIGDPGHAGVAHHRHPLAACESVQHLGHRAAPRCGRSPRPAVAAARRRAAAGVPCAGCPRSRSRRPRRGPRRPAGDRSTRLPIGVPTSTSVTAAPLAARAGRPPGGPTGRSDPASASITGAGPQHGSAQPAGGAGGACAHHAEVSVAERHVDREPHADRVHGPGRAQQQRALDAVTPEQAAPPGPAGASDLQAGQHLAVPAAKPRHGDLGAPSGPRQTLKRISRTSPSATS